MAAASCLEVPGWGTEPRSASAAPLGLRPKGFPSVFCKKTLLGSRGGAFIRDSMVLQRCGPLARLRCSHTVPALLSRLVPARAS